MEDDLHLSSITKNNELLLLKKKENEEPMFSGESLRMWISFIDRFQLLLACIVGPPKIIYFCYQALF